MHLELSITNDPRALAGVPDFIHATLRQLSLPAHETDELSRLTAAAVEHAVETAYPQGTDGLVKLTICENAGKLEIQIRDFGLPQDVRDLDQHLQDADATAAWLHGCDARSAVDQMHWRAFGPRGKALQLVKWLHRAHVAESSSAKQSANKPPAVDLAPQQQYTIRRMRPEEAAQVSQLMYLTYGNTYFNRDVYYPERIAAQNLHDTLLSIVAVSEDGHVAGHCALERNQDGPVAEIGQAVVDPAHRGRGLLDRMKVALEELAASLKLAGWYADAVAVHTFTQQSDAHHGGHVCGVDLAVSPKNEMFLDIAGKQPQRVSCVLYFHWLATPAKRQIFLPPRHQEMAAAIYQNLQCPCEFGEPASPTPEPGTFTVKADSHAALATIRAGSLGKDTAQAIHRASRELVERSKIKVIVIELPLSERATPEVCDSLEANGFAFVGIGPHFSPAGDMLKLAYLVEPLAKEPIKIFEPIAERLVTYALAEQERVRACC